MEAIKLILAFVMFLSGQVFITWISKNVKLVLATKTTTNTTIDVCLRKEDRYLTNIISLKFINGYYYVMVMHLWMHNVIIDIFAFLFGGMVMIIIISIRVVFATNKILNSEPEFSVVIITMGKIITIKSQMSFYQSPFD